VRAVRIAGTDNMSALFEHLRHLLHRVRSGSIEFSIKPYQRQLENINNLQDRLRRSSDAQLQSDAASLRQRILAGQSRSDTVCEAFALVREAADRTLHMRPYDVQMLAALVLHEGKVAEMQTGEGKTLAAVPAAFLASLAGQGVHVLTFNDYLARRDAQWMEPVYRFLGATVGHIQPGMTTAQRQAGYASDVTYITAKEAGFDFLRDQICMSTSQLVQRPLHYAIVDEADSILIDEARVPLVIAGQADELDVDIRHLADVVRQLDPARDYAVDGSWRNVNFTADGLDRIEQVLASGNLHSQRNLELLTRLNLALQAEVQLHRDVDYLVRDGRIELIDEFTGRVAENRRWPYGLQAAMEAKEGVPVQPDGMILGSITLQHFLAQYERLAGMTGTAVEAADELLDFYRLKVVPIPTHRPGVRRDEPDLVFQTKAAKQRALVAEIARVHGAGGPILVGTASVKESEDLAKALEAAHVTCHVLNAKNDEAEARIVADAGAAGAVTISTNMAGRGTDIRLGGRDEQGRDAVLAVGGLYVIGCNRHESRRIDNQLRGRCGRQGDPGRSRFFISLEDDLVTRYGVGQLDGFRAAADADGLISSDPQLTHRVAHSQRVIEGETFEIRRTLRRYAAVVERQRREFAARRQAILRGDVTLTLLSTRAADRCGDIASRYGEDVLHQAERQLTLHFMNRGWAEHLAHVAEIRDQIHLFSMGGLNPLDEFHRQINQAFNQLGASVDEAVLAAFEHAAFSAKGIDLATEGLSGPSSTWTYMINDTPMGDALDRITQGIKRRLSRGVAHRD
jgi:preprotein translocase subunit SecA